MVKKLITIKNRFYRVETENWDFKKFGYIERTHRKFPFFCHILFHMTAREIFTLDWNNIGFVICKPDAVYLNLEKGILSFLQQKGFQILACKYVTITPDLCRLLYWDEEKEFSNWWWEIESEFFNLGESLCVLVQGTPNPPYTSVSEMIEKKWKGNYKPEASKKGTIRQTFGSMNRIFNLFHSADCSKAAKREASLFFDEKIEGLINQDTPFLLKRKVNRSLDITNIYFKVKHHCIEVASIPHDVKQKYIIFLDEKKSQAVNLSNSKKQIWLYNILKEEYRMFYTDIYESKLLKCLTDYKHFKKVDYDALFQMLVKMGLKLTKWESCLLKTTMLGFT
jgi:nucleoside diphosphate kinase